MPHPRLRCLWYRNKTKNPAVGVLLFLRSGKKLNFKIVKRNDILNQKEIEFLFMIFFYQQLVYLIGIVTHSGRKYEKVQFKINSNFRNYFFLLQTYISMVTYYFFLFIPLPLCVIICVFVYTWKHNLKKMFFVSPKKSLYVNA